MEVFEDRLDDEVGLDDGLTDFGRGLHALQRRIGVVLRQLAFLDTSREVAPIGVASFAQLRFLLVLERDLDPMQGRLLGDLRTHAAGADHSEPFH